MKIENIRNILLKLFKEERVIERKTSKRKNLYCFTRKTLFNGK